MHSAMARLDEMAPDEPRIYVALGRASIALAQFDRAETYLLRALELEPDNAEAHSWFSFVYLQQGQIDEALQEAQEAIRLSPLAIGGFSGPS